MKLSYPKKLDIALPANRVCGVSIGKQVSEFLCVCFVFGKYKEEENYCCFNFLSR